MWLVLTLKEKPVVDMVTGTGEVGRRWVLLKKVRLGSDMSGSIKKCI